MTTETKLTLIVFMLGMVTAFMISIIIGMVELRRYVADNIVRTAHITFNEGGTKYADED